MWNKIVLTVLFSTLLANAALSYRDHQIEKAIGNDIFNIEALKRDCEKTYLATKNAYCFMSTCKQKQRVSDYG